MAHGEKKKNPTPTVSYQSSYWSYKNRPKTLSRMIQVMKRVKYFRLEENVWEPGSCNGEGITKLWSKQIYRLDPYLCTEVNSNKIGCMEKSLKRQISWRTC